MKIELLSITSNAQKLIEEAGRTCYKSKSGDNTDSNFIRGAIQRGHESIIEHASATFRISEVSRALSHQLVRHRLASFSQMSQRYTNGENFTYEVPNAIKNVPHLYEEFIRFMNETKNMYSYFTHQGIKPEDARSILPNACHTEIVMTANFREWRTIFKLRCDSHAQLDIRIMAKSILEILYSNAPDVFFDLYEKFIGVEEK
jgi:thymidylate synthase (FAD)